MQDVRRKHGRVVLSGTTARSPDSPLHTHLFVEEPRTTGLLRSSDSLPSLPALNHPTLSQGVEVHSSLEAWLQLLGAWDRSWFGISDAAAATSSGSARAAVINEQPAQAPPARAAVPTPPQSRALPGAPPPPAESIQDARLAESAGRTAVLEAAPAPVAIRQPTLPASADRGRSVSSSLPVPNSARSRSVKVPGLPKPPSKNVLNDDGAGSGARIGTWGDRQYMIPLPKHRVEAQSEEWAEEQVHGGKSWKAKNCLSAYDLLQRERAQQQPEADGSPYHARPGFGATTIPVGSASGGGGGSLRGGAVSSSLTSQLGQRVSSSAAAAPCGSPQRAPALRVTTHLQPVGPPSFRSTMMLGSLGRNRSSNNLLNNLVHEEEDEGDLAGGSGDEREKAVGGNDGASSSGRRANGDSTAAAAAIGERGAGSNGTRGVVSGSPRSLGGIGRVRAPHAPDAAKQQGSGAAAETAGGHAGASDQVEDDEDEEAAQRAAAWRWRFSRRWNAEQARPVSEKDAVMSPDATEEALQYLRACGGTGVALQVARTASSEYSSALRQHAGGGSTLGNLSLLGAEMLLADGSPAVAGGHRLSNTVRRSFDAGDEAGPGGRSGRTAASSSITTVARRAQQLLQEQRAIEQQAEQRWQASIAAAGDSWVGNLLTGVEIDDWGTFRFVAIKLRDRANRQKILVRGHNGSSEANLMEGINRKMLQLCSQHSLHPEVLEVLGSGVIEWRRDRDRHAHLHSATVTQTGTSVKPAELLKLVAVMVRQQLPLHYKVTVEGLSDI